MDTLLDTLKVPAGFARYDHNDADALTRLDNWKNAAHDDLAKLHDMVITNNLPTRQQARVVYAAAAFDGEGAWVTTRSMNASREILAAFTPPTLPLLESILMHEIKPLFKSNPHPSINVSTGRKLPRPAGGPMASQDYYEGQTWKGHPGAANAVLWCLRHVQAKDYERLWHLIIPPVMTFLDDYEVCYKLLGVQMVTEMLKRVPKDLLRRTGMDGLVLSSLSACLHYLQNPETPALIRAVVPTILTLIQLSTVAGSGQRFDQLCGLLGEGIIGSVWMYASDDVDTVLASVEVLPPLLVEMGIGSARYLKTLIPQLVHPLLPNPHRPTPIRLQISSADALMSLVGENAIRMSKWKGSVLEGIEKCIESVKGEDPESLELKGTLQRVCLKLKP